MKMKIITLSALSLFTTFSWAQTTLLYNSGATVKIEAGAVLYVEGGVHNLMGGTIDNDGTLEIQGNFLNQANWEGSQPNTLKFSGTGTSDLTPGSAVFQDVVIQKTAGNNVNLLGTMTVNDSLIFNATGSAKIVTNDFDVKLGLNAKVAGYDADEYVATTGTGMMEKTVDAGGTFEFPIGDLTNYSPITSVHSGTYAAANIRAKANDLTHPNKPADATEFITRYWDVNATGITSYSNTLTGTYIPADLTLGAGGTAAQVKGAVYDPGATEWTYAGAASGANTVTGITNDLVSDFTGTNFFGKVNLMVFLHGAYINGTSSMTTTLSSNGTIAALMLTSPYLDAPATVGAIPAGVTDWVKLELKDPGSPATVLGKASAFLKSNGTIVGLDGTSLPLIKNGLPTSIVGVIHRTHLSIRTSNTGLDVVNPTLHDFSAFLTNAYDNPAITTNDAMKLMPDGKYVMFSANGNSNTNIRYSGPGNDRDYLLGTILGGNTTTVLSNVYSTGDYNMNGVVRYSGPGNDRDFLLGQILLGNTTNVWNQHF